MTLPFAVPENLVLLQGAVAQIGTTADVNSRPISLKLVDKVWIYVNLSSLSSAAYTLTPQTDALVAFGSAAVLTTAVPIWSNADADTLTVYTRAADAVNFATAATANPKAVIFEIDPGLLASTEKCVRVVIPALAAADRVSVEYLIAPRYPQAANVNYFAD